MRLVTRCPRVGAIALVAALARGCVKVPLDAVELVDVALRVRSVDGRDLRALWLADARARDADVDAIAALIPVHP